MPDSSLRSYFLLSCFAEFYEAVADIKLAIQEGRLAALLGNGALPAKSSDVAALVSGRLGTLLGAQLNRVARESPPATVRAHRIAGYAMAALVDEIFVLELEWAGRDAWLDVLLEYRLFKSRVAGRKLFILIQQLLDLPAHDALSIDLAAVLLMVLQLGFKGEHRGPQGNAALQQLRARLFALLRGADSKLAFPQAYQHLDESAAPSRLAPLTPWYIGGGIVAAIYLLISTGVWLHLTQPFLDAVAGK